MRNSSCVQMIFAPCFAACSTSRTCLAQVLCGVVGAGHLRQADDDGRGS